MTTNIINKKGKLRPPPAIKARTGVVCLAIPDKLSLGKTYVTAQVQSDPSLGGKVAAQAAVVKQAHDTLVQKVTDRKTLEDTILVKDAEIVSVIQDYDTALQDYALGAVKVASGDVLALKALGVTPASTTRARITGPPEAPENIKTSAGPTPGSLIVKHSRPAEAGSFAVQYKLEPSRPEDPWEAPDSLQSRSTVHQLDGLAPGQLVRTRVRALGEVWGSFSDEVVDRAQ